MVDRRPTGPRRYPPGYMQNFKLPNGLTMNNFKNKLNKLNTKWNSEKSLKAMVEATLLRKYGSKNTTDFYTKFPKLATGPFRDILNRTTNKNKRFQPFSRRPSLTPSNAQYQILKTKDPKGEYYGNSNILKLMTEYNVNKFMGLSNLQKDAIKRMIRSIRVNDMASIKSKVRYGSHREELTNNLMAIKNDVNLLKELEKRVAKRRANNEAAGRTNSGPAPKNKGAAPSAPATPPARSFIPTYGAF